MSKTRNGNKCDYCGLRNVLDEEVVPGWYVGGKFVPMAGGQFLQCLDCVLGKSREYDEDEETYAVVEKIRKHIDPSEYA